MAVNNMKDEYKKLLQRSWKGKSVWEHIRDEELSAAPALVGKLYNNSDNKVKIMFVGRAVNGWQVDFNDCSTIDNTVDSVVDQENIMDDFAKDFTIDKKTGKKYYYAKSSFLRLLKNVVKGILGTDKDWQQRMVWSNLYKIGPRDGGNPSWRLIKNDIPIYIDLLRQEIIDNEPDVVVFITDISFFDPYPNNKKYGSFYELVDKDSIQTANLPEQICFKGKFAYNKDVKIIVCKRPEGIADVTIRDSVVKMFSD